MNGKQRARWYADLISDAQRLHKKARGCADAALLGVALTKLGEARALALAEVEEAPAADNVEVVKGLRPEGLRPEGLRPDRTSDETFCLPVDATNEC